MKRLFNLAAALCILATFPLALKAQSGDKPVVWRPVRWAFPKADQTALEIDGQKVYQLSRNIFGVIDEFNGREIRKILFAKEIVAAAELAHVQDPNKTPDVDRFLTAFAVRVSVETPVDYNNEFLGTGKLDGVLLYIYKTKSGSHVAATVTPDRRKVLILPAPSPE